MLGLALAGDGQHVVVELDVDVLLGQTGQVGAQDELVLGLDQVHRRQPAAGTPTPPFAAVGASKKVLNSRFISL